MVGTTILLLVKSCFLIHNKNYCEQKHENDRCEHDSTAYIMNPINEWLNSFSLSRINYYEINYLVNIFYSSIGYISSYEKKANLTHVRH